MSLIYSYAQVRVRRPIHPLGGRMTRSRALIGVSIVGPLKTHPDLGMLDTGADDTVFRESVAAQIGIDLTNAPIGDATFRGGREEVELVTNPFYPGRSGPLSP